MPFYFSLVCDLFDQCYRVSINKQDHANTVVAWFARHRDRVKAHDTNIAALLSTLLPEKRTDRVYCIQATGLERIIGRALMLGSSRIAELALYRKPGHGTDLGDCVERILSAAPNPTRSDTLPLTVEQIDALLHRMASKTKWSSPAVRTSESSNVLSVKVRNDLEDLYRQLSPTEAKWFTRLVLKDFRPIIFEPSLLYRLCDPLLPHVMRIRDDFTASISIVSKVRAVLLPSSACPAPAREQVLTKIKPKLGLKVGRQTWVKGRSIKHCLEMGHGRMSVENKIDGEYCQIHVDLSDGGHRIQIFSKSGKDSTEDRHAILDIISESLNIGTPACQLQKGCILEGELVVYDHERQKILPFHKIRKYVARRGVFLNTEQDSQQRPQERLMIVYYDLLLLDNESLLGARHSERFKLLQRLINCTKGQAELVRRVVIDFGRSTAASDLRKVLAKTICDRAEGLVLKPDDPYFTFRKGSRQFSSCCIKLKKDYIGHFGDVGDFAVVGAGFDPGKAKASCIPDLIWTHFYIGCLNNKEEVDRWKAMPDFTVVNVVEPNESLLKTLIRFGNPLPVAATENKTTKLRIAPGLSQGISMSVAFQNPLVFDMRCFGFDKAGNTGFWSLRFPVVTRIHFDRDCTDTLAFNELQKLAEDATTAPDQEDSQETLRWIALLENADPRGVAVDASSQQTASTISTPPRNNVMQPQKRRALEDIDANSSQHSSSMAMPSIENPVIPELGYEGIATSPSEFFAQENKSLALGKLSLPIPHTGPSSAKARLPKRNKVTHLIGEQCSSTLGIGADLRKVCMGKSCKYSGSRCQLSSYIIFLPAELIKANPEVSSLLKKHGAQSRSAIYGSTSIVEPHGAAPEGIPRSALLVDSTRKDEFKDLVRRMETSRASYPELRREWIDVYDWRMLRDITNQEDDEIGMKSFGGFANPWRRWYCGLV